MGVMKLGRTLVVGLRGDDASLKGDDSPSSDMRRRLLVDAGIGREGRD